MRVIHSLSGPGTGTAPRRHDIDALRALAFGCLILYHVGMAYVPGWDWHVKSAYAADWLLWPMRMLNIWRMDLIFLISGVALCALGRSRAPGELLARRSGRLLVPLLFGMAVIVPLQPYLQGVSKGLVEPGFGTFLARYYAGGPWPRGAFDGWQFGVTWNHLWYLAYLWVYTALLVLASSLVRFGPIRKLRDWFAGLRGLPLLLVPALPLAFYSMVLAPRFPPTHDLLHDWYLHATYFTIFAYGWWIGLGRGFWDEASRLRHRAILLALACFVANAVFGENPTLRSLYLWNAVLAALGYAHAHLNRPFRWLDWANESVYPWYLLHQTFIVALVFFTAPLALGPWIEPALVLCGTVLGCWWVTDGVVRRVQWLRPLFGLKVKAHGLRPGNVLRRYG